jgi:hypothetical protein
MTMRPQTISVAVLLVALGLIFLLVGNAGVSTGVFLPEPTLTPIPPTATPLPDPAVDHWSETAPGQVAYTADPETPAQIVYQTMPLDTYIQQRGLETPAADAALPLLDLLQQRRELYATQIEELGLQAGPDALEGPAVEKFGGVPVAMLRVKVPPQPLADGREFPGLDLIEGLVERPEGEVTYVEYSLGAEPDVIVHNDFRAWLEINAARLAGQDDDEAADDAPDDEAAPEPADEPDDQPAPEADSTEEPADETTVPEPTEEATAEPDEEPAQEATEEPADEPAPEATDEPGDEGAAMPDDAPAEEPGSEAAAPAQGWTEVAPGQYLHATTSNAFVGHQASTMAALSGQLGIEPPADDAEEPVLDILTAAKNDLEFQVTGLGVTFAEDSIEGPEMREYDSVPVAYFHAALNPTTTAEGQSFPGQEMALVIIDQGEGNIQLIQLQYIYEDQPDPAIYADFQTWLEDNTARLLTLVSTEEPAPQPEVTAEPGS